MIYVEIKYEKMEYIKSIVVKGHAGYDVYGKDIVCAGVSAVMYGGINALCSFIDDEKYINIIDKNEKENTLGFEISSDTYKKTEIQTILQTIKIQLKTIYDNYQDYISFDIKYYF